MSSALVSGIEGLPGIRVDHTSLSPDRLLLCDFSHCCSKRPWSLFLSLFTVLVILGPLLPLLFGRIIEIKVFVRVRAKGLLLVFPDS